MLDTKSDLYKENKIKEYRQLRIISESIKIYRNQKITLDMLIRQLEFFVESLNECDKNWKDTYQKNVNALEVVRAFFIYDKKETLSSDDLQDIQQSLNTLEDLINKRIEDYLPLLEQYELEGYDISL